VDVWSWLKIQAYSSPCAVNVLKWRTKNAQRHRQIFLSR
jgi:hypothetical protein